MIQQHSYALPRNRIALLAIHTIAREPFYALPLSAVPAAMKRHGCIKSDASTASQTHLKSKNSIPTPVQASHIHKRRDIKMPPKTEGTIGLNNYLQSKHKTTSLSWIETPTGPQTEIVWVVVAKIDGVERGRGTGAQKYVAKDNAANQTIAYLKSLE
ncbi:hypothetical protein BDZ89DRAFT_1141950 [Hymenopellis radicata]|nr:hypothetical protein BDZ89DRAFT_1141950 [Hymenopellis radicata]